MTTRRESTRSEIQAVALLEAALVDRPDHVGALRLHTALVRSQADWATIIAGGSR